MKISQQDNPYFYHSDPKYSDNLARLQLCRPKSDTAGSNVGLESNSLYIDTSVQRQNVDKMDLFKI